MARTMTKNMLINEINLIPEDKLLDLYQVVHYFRLGLERSLVAERKTILEFAGCWQDMEQTDFDDFLAEVRRHFD